MHEDVLKSPALIAGAFCLLAGLGGCGQAASPPPPGQNTQPQTQIQVPPGQTLVTVAASSNPPGAVVTGGGRMLGRTPFTAQVPIPAPQSGETQTFQFTFQLPNYQPVTVSASPINQTITLSTTLSPLGAQPTQAGGGVVAPAPGAPSGQNITATGPAGGPIFDNHTTTSTARVNEQCVIGAMSVDLDGAHTFNSDLVISLRGPDGESYTLQRNNRRSPFRRFNVREAAGHPSAGAWTVSIRDTVARDSGQFRGWSLRIECR